MFGQRWKTAKWRTKNAVFIILNSVNKKVWIQVYKTLWLKDIKCCHIPFSWVIEWTFQIYSLSHSALCCSKTYKISWLTSNQNLYLSFTLLHCSFTLSRGSPHRCRCRLYVRGFHMLCHAKILIQNATQTNFIGAVCNLRHCFYNIAVKSLVQG